MRSVYVHVGFTAVLFLCAFSVSIVFADLNDGLVLYYPFDSTPAGGIVADQSGQGNNGVVHGAPLRVEGKRGNAYCFDGTNDFIQTPPSASLDVGTQLTCAVWFKVFNYACGRPILEWCDPLAGLGKDFGAHMWVNVHGGEWIGTGANLCEGWGWPGKGHIISVPDPSVNEWHHLAVTYSASSGMAMLYLDGVPVAVRNFGAFRAGTSRDFFVGCRPSEACRWNGLLDEVRVYNRVLSADEIAALYKGWSSTDPPCITFVGFSSAAEGDQDVTEFFTDETLFIKVRDVSLETDSNATVNAILRQASRRALFVDLARQRDGRFAGAVPLNKFNPGPLRVTIKGFIPDRTMMKDTDIMLYAPAKTR